MAREGGGLGPPDDEAYGLAAAADVREVTLADGANAWRAPLLTLAASGILIQQHSRLLGY